MNEDQSQFGRLYSIIKQLRAPEGCPWDRKQTPESLKRFLLEELYESFEAIDDHDTDHLREELGDIYMLVTMIAYMLEQQQAFTVEEVFEEVNAKLIRRHPHVFGDVELSTSDEVVRQWDDIKENVEGRGKNNSVLEKVPKNMPPLERAHQIQKRCAQVGFDWTGVNDVWEKVDEEMQELREADGNREETEEEFGDLLFSLINLSRFLKIDPAVALHRANTKFVRRFGYVEREMQRRGQRLAAENMQTMDALWDEAKESAAEKDGR